MWKKKIFMVVMVFIMALEMMVPIISKAEEITGSSDSRFKCEILSDGSIEITDYVGSDTEVVIPESIDGYEVTSIGAHAFSGCSSLTSITIPESVTSIDSEAFR